MARNLNSSFTSMDWLEILKSLDNILSQAEYQLSQNISEENRSKWEEIASIIRRAKTDEEGIYSPIIIKVNGVEDSFTREDYKILKEQIKIYTESTYDNATPYITKVVNHWYRNQYFTAVDEQDLSGKKTRLRTLINKIYNYFGEGYQTEGGAIDSSLIDSSIKEERANSIEEISKITTEEGIKAFLSNQQNIWEQKATTEELKAKIQNEFEAVSKEFSSEITGTAYEVQGNPEPFWHPLSESTDTFGGNELVSSFMKKLYIKETRSADLVQVHNPVFEDNSQYIRNWLKEKYYIYKTNVTANQEDSEGETLSDAKISQGKEYIQGKTALQIVTDMIEECKYERDDISYMLRDLQELFTDFEFDLENVEVPAQKMLDNVMPDYEPYTPWPSVYENAEDNCTKMIYKTNGSSKIVAPANGIITKAENNLIEIKFTSDDEQTSATNGMILHIESEQGSLSGLPSINAEVARGNTIATANPQNGMIILKLRLFSQTKQLLKVENYMTVERKTYDSLTDEEKIYLYNLQETEIDIEKTQDTITARVALMNLLFNKIASPYYPQYASVEAILGSAEKAKEADFLSYANNNGPVRNKNLTKLENNNKQGKFAIINALAGVDITKTYTLIGATRYFALDDEYYKQSKVDTGTKEQKLNEAKNLIIQFQIGNRMLGITEDEYIAYLGDVLEKKINEVIYSLNLEKYTSGLEEYLELLSQFKSAKTEVIDYYVDGKFLVECGNGEDSESMKTITNVIKSNISQEREDIEGQEGKEKVIDKFTITVNSNYSTKWTFTYTKGTEGKIEGDIKVEHEAIRNY